MYDTSDELRRDLEQETAIEVPRRGRSVRIVAPRPRIEVAALPRRPGVVVEGDDLDRFSPAEWRPDDS